MLDLKRGALVLQQAGDQNNSGEKEKRIQTRLKLGKEEVETTGSCKVTTCFHYKRPNTVHISLMLKNYFSMATFPLTEKRNLNHTTKFVHIKSH